MTASSGFTLQPGHLDYFRTSTTAQLRRAGRQKEKVAVPKNGRFRTGVKFAILAQVHTVMVMVMEMVMVMVMVMVMMQLV